MTRSVNKVMNNKTVTILNFECKDCNYKVGQLTTDAFTNEEDIKCTKCASKNVTYSTFLQQIYMEFLNIIGLALNFIGALIIAFSVIENPGKAHQMVNDKKLYLASIILSRFRWGMGVFVLGFLLQFISTVC